MSAHIEPSSAQRAYRRRIGLIPAAGRATRMSPIPCSKELFPVGYQAGATHADRRPKAVSRYLLERMRAGGAHQAFFIIRPGKADIAEYYGDGESAGMPLGYLQAGRPWGPPFTLAQAIPFVGDADILFGFPDILIEPADCFTPLLARMHQTDADVVLGTFPATARDPGDVLTLDAHGRVLDLRTKEELPERPEAYICWMFAVWSQRFTQFLGEECGRLEQVARARVASQPGLKAPEWPVGALIAAGIRAGLQVESVLFPEGRFLDVGTPDGLAAAACFPGVWDGTPERAPREPGR